MDRKLQQEIKVKLPFFQFYPSDYKRDTCALSLAAKGGWIDILCMLHGAQNRGTMTLPDVGWARLMGATVDQAAAVIDELAAMHVAEVIRGSNGEVTISSRRMLRDAITREQTRLRVLRHRSNAACNANGNDKVTDKKSEVRSQKPEYNTEEGQNETAQRPTKRAAKATPTSDAEWLAGLVVDPAYLGIDVAREHAKAVRWCSERRQKMSRRRFINWLNRCDRPLVGITTEKREWTPPAGEY